MFKTLSAIGLAAGSRFLSSAALAEQGNSSSWGTVGCGSCDSHPVAHELRPRVEHANQSKYQAYDSAEWLRQHGKGLFPFFH